MKVKLSKIRERMGLSVTQLAEMCGVSRQSIHSIENGKYKPSVVLAMIISNQLGLKVEDIFELEKDDLNEQ